MVKHAMVREEKKDSRLVILLLDTYLPKTDTIEYIDTKTREKHIGRYHAIHNRTIQHHITVPSQEESALSSLISPDGAPVVFLDKFSNPNRTRQGGAA